MNKFQVERKQVAEGQVVVLSLTGFLDAHTASELEATIAEVVEQENNNIVVDFQELDYISSAGLGVFMVFIEEIREKGGDIKLSAMKPKVFNVFDLLGFPMLFDIFETTQTALEKFGLRNE